MPRVSGSTLPLARDSGWSDVVRSAAALFVPSVVPLPGPGGEHFGPYGPDKWLHVFGHGWFTSALATALDGDGRSDVVVAVAALVASSVFGVWVERLQGSIPGRRYERADVWASVVGSVVGVAHWHVRRNPSSVGENEGGDGSVAVVPKRTERNADPARRA